MYKKTFEDYPQRSLAICKFEYSRSLETPFRKNTIESSNAVVRRLYCDFTLHSSYDKLAAHRRYPQVNQSDDSCT